MKIKNKLYMYGYKVVVGVDLINEIFVNREGGGGLFKGRRLNLLKNWTIGHKQYFF